MHILAVDLEAIAEELEVKRQLIQRSLSIDSIGADHESCDEPIGRLTGMNVADATKARMRITLSQIECALQRVKNGSYGECTSCGEQIARARLIHTPEAPHCLGCQSADEQT